MVPFTDSEFLQQINCHYLRSHSLGCEMDQKRLVGCNRQNTAWNNMVEAIIDFFSGKI